MKLRICLVSIFSFVFVPSLVTAQNPYLGSVTVFSEEGENFTLYLNGDRKNGAPASKVVVDNVTEVPVSFRITFENASIPEVKKSGFRGGKDCTYAVQKNKKGEHVLRIKGCTDPFPEGASSQMPPSNNNSYSSVESTVTATPPAQLSATYVDGTITINDGRTLTITKVKANGMTYPRVLMNAPANATATITYDDNTEKYTSEIPFKYEVKDFSNNNSFFKLTVDEGGPEKTWYVRLQNSNGYDLKID